MDYLSGVTLESLLPTPLDLAVFKAGPNVSPVAAGSRRAARRMEKLQ
jgi:hypothetical protein